LVTVECAWCGKEKEVTESKCKRQKNFFCCIEHKHLYYRFSKGTKEVECEVCGKKVLKTKRELEKYNHHFCSNECAHIFRKKRVVFPCDWCGKPVEYPKSHVDRAVKHFCNKDCMSRWRSQNIVGSRVHNYSRVTTTCYICGKEHEVKQSIFQRNNRNFCGDECRLIFYQSDENKKQQRKNMLKTLSTYPRRTRPEKIMRKLLTELSVKFDEQVTINDKFCVDFYVPNNIVIEVFGDYFHANPEIYGEGKKPIDDLQKKNLNNDNRRTWYLNKCGYEVWAFWEKDLYERPKEIQDSIASLLKKRLENYI
jgi:very-short-patch-repair endonuclease